MINKFKQLLMLALFASTCQVASAFVVDGVYYNIISSANKTVEVTSKGSTNTENRYAYVGDITIPQTVIYNGDEYSVQRIGSHAFWYCSYLTSVGDLSFCKSIGTGAFEYCSSLTSIGDLSACTSIGEDAFLNCSSLTNIGDLSACKSIGKSAFSGCQTLPIITIPTTSVVNLGSSDAIGAITTIRVSSNLLENYRNANYWKELSSRIIAIGSEPAVEQHVTMQENSSGLHAAIGEENLANVIELKIVGDINGYDIGIIRDKMPNLHFLDLSQARIRANLYKYYGSYSTANDVLGAYTFYAMPKLVKIALPNNIKSIGNYAFENCFGLQEVNIPLSATKIGTHAFYQCEVLKKVDIPANVTSIGSSAFQFCRKLQSVHFAPNSKLANITEQTFYYCQELSSLELTNNISSIGGMAFGGCKSLSELYLPSSLKTVGKEAFNGCTNLRNVYVTAPNAYDVTIADNSFDATTCEQGTLYVPYDEETRWRATYDTYYWQTQWKRFLNIEKWKPEYDRFPIDNDYDQQTGTIPGDAIDAEFGTNAGYMLGEEAYQYFKSLHIKSNGSKGVSVIVEGGQNLVISELVHEIDVQGKKWYFFCFPFDIKIEEISCGDAQYVFRKYDGEERAKGKSGWKNLDSDETILKAGVGYIFQANKAGLLALPVAEPNFDDSNKSAELASHVASDDKDASWNFIGNPFLSYYQLDDLGFDAPVTYWNGTSYVAVRAGDDSYAFQPYQAFFVQKTPDSQEVGFDPANRQTYTQSQAAIAAARNRRARQMINPDRLLVNLVLSDGENEDVTRVVYNNEKSAGYEAACDAAKFMSTEAVPQLFTVAGDVQYAINERPQGEVDLGYKAVKAGTYEISTTRMDIPMLLKDLKTGVTFDFSIGQAYSFETEAGNITDRFVLVPNPTENHIEGMTVGDAETPAFFNLAGQLTTSNADGVKIMMQGDNAKKMMMR